jgi:dipeptidyl aminopeptidase/acylaminoacyl peptidase
MIEQPPSAVLLPRRLLLQADEPGKPSLSPCGRKVAWREADHILVADIGRDGLAAPLRFSIPFTSTGPLLWSWTAQYLLFESDEDGDECWRPNALDIATGKLWPLASKLQGKTLLHRVSPDVRSEVLLLNCGRDARFFDVCRADIASGDHEMVWLNDRFDSIHADASLAPRFGRRIGQDGSADYFIGDGQGAWRRIAQVSRENIETSSVLSIASDGTSAYLLEATDRDGVALHELVFASGSRRVIAQSAKADVAGAVIEPRTGRPVAAWIEDRRREWLGLAPKVGRAIAELTAGMPQCCVKEVACSADCKRMLAVLEGDRTPWKAVVMELGDGAGRARSVPIRRQAAAPRSLRSMRTLSLTARDGLPLQSYLTLPRPSAEPPPLVLVVHGGPHDRDEWGYAPRHQWLANRGYAVLSVNYRGSTGYGRAFLHAADGEWGGRMQDDLEDAVGWAIHNGHAEPGRIAILGSSYGGYAALYAVTRTSSPFACAVSFCGVTDLPGLMETLPRDWLPRFSLWKRRLADPDTPEGLEWLKNRSPIGRVDRVQVPLLVAQGLRDPRVCWRQATSFVDALRRSGKTVSYVAFPGEGHSLKKPANILAFAALTERFLANHIGGSVEPSTDELHGARCHVELAASSEGRFPIVELAAGSIGRQIP